MKEEERIEVTALPRTKPDVGLYVSALIAFARQLQKETGPEVTNG